MSRSRKTSRTGRITATDAAKNFGRLVSRVREEGATYTVHRGGVPVAQIAPAAARGCTVAEFRAFLASRRPVLDEHANAVEAAVERHNTPRVRRNPWAR